MLHLSLHAGPRSKMQFSNMLGFADMTPTDHGFLQTYKAVFFSARRATAPLVSLANYPRYATTLWDLAGRLIALHLRERAESARKAELEAAHELACAAAEEEDLPEPEKPVGEPIPLIEQVLDPLPPIKRTAYAQCVSAVIERMPDAKHVDPEVLCGVEITCTNRSAGTYQAVFSERGLENKTVVFKHETAYLMPWRLLLAAIAHHLCGQDLLPPRPAPSMPTAEVEDGVKVVKIDDIAQPMRTALCGWLAEQLDFASIERSRVPESRVLEFLQGN